MSLRIRRGTEAQRPSATFDLGEIVWTTDTNKLYVGDGVNLGGKNILATSAGTGLIWNTTTQRLDFNGSGTGIVSVQADANPTLGGNLNLNNRNITGTGNINITGTVTATQFVGTRVSSDNNPQLGGNLNLNNRNITGTGNISITGNIVNTVTTSQAIIGGTLQLSGVNNTGAKAGIEIITDGSADDGYSLFNIRGRNAGATGNVIGFERGRGTHLNPTRLLTGDEIMTLVWFGLDHISVATPTAAMRVSVAGVTNSGIVPGKIELATADATGNLTPGITIHSDQIVEFANKTVTANSGSGSANVSGGVSTYLKIKVNGIQYAMPLYGIVP